MHQIKPHEITALVNEHYEELSEKIHSGFPQNKCKYSVEQILKALPNTLIEIVEWFNKLSDNDKADYKYIVKCYKNFSIKKKEYNAYHLAKNLNVQVCPYCNRNYTFTVTTNQEEIIRPDFDHFYDKITYPILALSFFNLIPSCTDCNRTLKKNKKFSISTHIHPYSEGLNQYTQFNFKIKCATFYQNKENIEIIINTTDARAEATVCDLRLREIYNQGYKHIVLELVQKSQIYCGSYIDELFERYYGTIFSSRKELLILITGAEMEPENIGKRPLNKLIQDISSVLELR